MKKLALGTLIALVAACGGGKNNTKIKVVDGNTDTGPMTCSPLTQAGCQASEKCTWIVDQTTPTYVGHIGCAPAGSAATDAECSYGPAGGTGYDNCVKGDVCSTFKPPLGRTGTCKAICDNQGGDPKCDATHTCVTYALLFSTGSTTPAAGGLCNPRCNPFTDNDYDGSGSASHKTTMACGSADPSLGCYGHPSQGLPPASDFSCVHDYGEYGSDGTFFDHNFRHRTDCTAATGCADANGNYYNNSCDQGYIPLFYDHTGTTDVICTAICHPLDCYLNNCNTNNTNRSGQFPDRCAIPDRQGSLNSAPGHEECRYMWSLELDGSGNWLPSDWSDSAGWCFDHSMYKYDPTGGNNPTLQLPGCEQVQLHGTDATGSGDPTMPTTYFGAVDPVLGCVNSSLAIGSGSATGKHGPVQVVPPGITIDQPRMLYHREMQGE